MTSLPSDVLDEILNRTDLISVISEYVPLKKSGKEYKGCCPFHQEKTPSFMVSPEKRVFHCFGCGQGGNAYGFLMKIENLSFPEAVEKLARLCGVDLKRYQGASDKKDEREILYKINRYAAWFFAENLKSPQGKKCRDYLAGRNIEPAVIEEFNLGYAPDSWNALVSFLQSKNVPLSYAESLGLVRKRQDGSCYDFFRDRLMFPIMDAEGRVLAFGGRRLDDKKEEAKYINSPESLVYHKGSCLYGLFQAKKSIRETREIILVEGNIDLIRLHQSGLKNTVAPLGTALTMAQVQLLARVADKFVLLLDGDEAGRRACERALNLMLGMGHHPRLVSLPAGEDPDSFVIKRGIETLNKWVKEASPAVEGIIIEAFSKAGAKTSGRVDAARRILPLVEQIRDEVEKKAYKARLSRLLDMPENMLEGRARSFKKDRAFNPASLENQSKNSLERILIRLYVKKPQIVHPVLGTEVFGSFENEELKNLGLKLADYYQQHHSLELDKLLGPEMPWNADDLTELAFGDEGEEESFKVVLEDCLYHWKKRRLKAELVEITGAIHIAELKGDREELTGLLVRKNEAVQGLKNLDSR